MAKARLLVFAIAAARMVVTVGCDDPSVLSGSEIAATASAGAIGALLLTPATGCLAQAAATSYFIDGAPMAAGASPCGASSSQLDDDRSFVLEVRNHGDQAELVVADMFPGRHATLIAPASGRVRPGDALTVAVPPVLRDARPYVAHFVYLDSDIPDYVGSNFFFEPQATPDRLTLVAPSQMGRYQIQISMESADASAFVPGRIVSCSGVAKCSARASIDLGPIPLDVVP